VAALALEFTILTAARSGEVIGARWSEVDLAKAIWTVPAERMKAGKEHRVPLSRALWRYWKA
jgi:integrase